MHLTDALLAYYRETRIEPAKAKVSDIPADLQVMLVGNLPVPICSAEAVAAQVAESLRELLDGNPVIGSAVVAEGMGLACQDGTVLSLFSSTEDEQTPDVHSVTRGASGPGKGGMERSGTVPITDPQ